MFLSQPPGGTLKINEPGFILGGQFPGPGPFRRISHNVHFQTVEPEFRMSQKRLLLQRNKKSPELVKEVLKLSPAFKAPSRFIVFKRWDLLERADNPEVVIFFAQPDVLAGLFTLSNFEEAEPNGVIAPFGAGCSSVIQHPYLEGKAARPRAVIGMFDVSARPHVPPDVLTFAAPMVQARPHDRECGGELPHHRILAQSAEQNRLDYVKVSARPKGGRSGSAPSSSSGSREMRLVLNTLPALMYSMTIDRALAGIRARVPDFSGMKAGDRVLDVCCGTGAQTFFYASKGIISWGIDVDPGMIEFAEKRKRRLGLNNPFFQRASAGNLPFRNALFDHASISMGLHEKEGPLRDRIISEMKRVVKEGWHAGHRGLQSALSRRRLWTRGQTPGANGGP